MKMRVVVYGSALMVLAMIGYRLFGGEELAVADGRSAATELPLDKASSRVAFETATFGLG
jgi:hypothetical protein